MALTKLEQSNFDTIVKMMGTTLPLMTADEALLLAIEAEQTAKDCGPGDPAFLHFAKEARMLENFAYLIEKKDSK